jgi:mannose-6-phosphate isomerase, type 1 (EC 5.3.1.8)
MRNPIQTYQWGSRTALPALFNIPNPDQQPQAEIWMGAHPKASSEIQVGTDWLPLNTLIESDPQSALSAEIYQRFGELPFLFKVLAADTALSIQVHPSKQEAEHGYQKENQQGIPLSAAHRNYKDPNHKPELVYALTAFKAMNGFRPHEEIINNVTKINNDSLNAVFQAFVDTPTADTLQSAFAALLALESTEKTEAVNALMAVADENATDAPFDTIIDLATQYPEDIGLFAPLLLNVVTLSPGDAMFLHARTPHAYIHGVGLEVMANSDNVLRAGLTPKHIDVDELIACTSFIPITPDQIKLPPQSMANGEYYPVSVPDFSFSRYRQVADIDCDMQSAEILFAVNAPLTVVHAEQTVTIEKGESVFIPACTATYTLSAMGDVVRVKNTLNA